jgi:hypothetical protein
MRRKRITVSSRGVQPKPSRLPTVAELAKRMSELMRLRDKVERAERADNAPAASRRRPAPTPPR